MGNIFEEKLKIGYEKYLELPKFSRMGGSNNEMYNNKWCVLTGRACITPHPHRHYTFIEFVFACGKHEELKNRFVV